MRRPSDAASLLAEQDVLAGVWAARAGQWDWGGRPGSAAPAGSAGAALATALTGPTDGVRLRYECGHDGDVLIRYSTGLLQESDGLGQLGTPG